MEVAGKRLVGQSSASVEEPGVGSELVIAARRALTELGEQQLDGIDKPVLSRRQNAQNWVRAARGQAWRSLSLAARSVASGGVPLRLPE